MATFPFPTKVSQASTKTSDQKFIVASYGDGYEQRAAIGIDNMFDVWSVQVNYLSLSDRTTMLAFWRAHGRVVSFDWTPPNGTVGKYIFNAAINESNYANRYSFTFDLRQVFE